MEELTSMFEQGEVPAPQGQKGIDALSGPTYVGQQMPPKKDPLAGPTYVAPAAAGGGMVPANTLVNVKKQLAVLSGEIDKILAGLGSK